ncbi:MAG: PIG-L family deacetylase [Acidobacteriota bacterium]
MNRRICALIACMALLASAPASQTPSLERGAAGAWQALLKVRTTASVMHTTAHPDDEQGGVLARLSRHDGARVTLATLTRGEAGDNAIGSELFDALGLIRTEELSLANRYYGVDQQYFTTVVDYGFSKRLEEAFDKWGRDAVLRDLVRIIRVERPWVLISRFQGAARDGHGNHQAAGLLTRMAFEAAGDPSRFPDQLAEGLRPWRPFKLYVGGVRENESWTVRIDTGEYSPVLGDSFDNIARRGLSLQRSQTAGRFVPTSGPNLTYLSRVATRIDAPDREASVWDGLDTTYAGLFATLGRPLPTGAAALLAGIDASVARAAAAFTLQDPSRAAPALAEGLRLTRAVLAAIPGEDDARHVLTVKAAQFEHAIASALGLELTATAEPSGRADAAGPGTFQPSPTMPAPVPGQAFGVRVQLANRGGVSIAPLGIALDAADGWTAVVRPQVPADPAALPRHDVFWRWFRVTVAPDAPISTRPYFARDDIRQGRYTLTDPAQFGRPVSAPPLVAVARFAIDGVEVALRATVRRRESRAPYGDAFVEVRAVPRLSVSVEPASLVVPLTAAGRPFYVDVAVTHHAGDPSSGRLALRVPAGWTATPPEHPWTLARVGERAVFRFAVTAPGLDARPYVLEAVAVAAGREYRDGFERIEHRDLEPRYLYRPSTATVRGVDVAVVPGLQVGYVMGIGDQVPAGLAQLGAQVTLLDARELADGDLSRFDAIVTGTRAYAVRDDLRASNRRLLDYTREGGNLIVLYNTQEFVPAEFAPYPAELPMGAEEVSEEDSPVDILAPAHQAFTWPNRITAADFEGWVEQRGSKFFATWDAAYTPMIATWDTGQAPQRGGWLTTRYGRGTWTYFAYALHRQLPYGVPGAFRITANLLALGKTP